MKQYFVTSLLLFLATFSLGIELGSLSGQNYARDSQDLKMALQAYERSKDKRLTNLERLNKVNFYLKEIENMSQDSLFYNGWMQKTLLLGRLKMYDSAIYCTKKLLNRASEKKDSLYIGKALKKLGLYHQNNDSLANAFRYYNEAFKIYRKTEDSLQAGTVLYSMSKIQQRLGDIVGSQNTAIDGLKYLEITSDLRTIAGLQQIITIAYKENKNYETAIEWSDKNLGLLENPAAAEAIGKKNFLKFKNTRANILALQKKYNAALNIFNDLLSDSIVMNDNLEYARVLNNKAYTLWLQNEENLESENLFLEARAIRTNENSTSGIISSNVKLADYYFRNYKEKALLYALEAYEKAHVLKNPVSVIEALDFITELEQNPNEYYKELSNTRKELMKQQNILRGIYEPTRYQNELLAKENAEKELSIEKQKTNKNLAITFGLLILTSSAFLFLYLKQRHKQRIKIGKVEASYETETKLSKKVHDELANDVSDTMNFVTNSYGITDVVKVPLLNNLEDIYLRTRNIATETGSIDLTNFPQTLKYLLLQHNNKGVKVITNPIKTISWDQIADYKKVVIYRCIQELMINMKKHSQASEVTLAFRSSKQLHEIRYTDNGKGTNLVSKRINGLYNVETRMESIGGTFSFETSEGIGFKASLIFPK